MKIKNTVYKVLLDAPRAMLGEIYSLIMFTLK